MRKYLPMSTKGGKPPPPPPPGEGFSIAMFGIIARGFPAGGYDGELPSINRPRLSPFITDAIQVTGGFGHTAFLRSDHTVWGSSGGPLGTLAQGTPQLFYSPVKIWPCSRSRCEPEPCVELRAQSSNMLLLMQSGRVVVTGGNGESCSGRGDSRGGTSWVPDYVETEDGAVLGDGGPGRPPIIQIYPGAGCSLFLDAAHNLWTTGVRLGEGGIRQEYAVRLSAIHPTLKSLDGEVIEVANRESITVVRLKFNAAGLWKSGNNNIRTFGDNSFYQWGDGNTNTSPTTTEMMTPHTPNLEPFGSPCAKLGPGLYNVVITLANGWGVGWGKNDKGQAGVVNGFQPVLLPTRIGTLTSLIGASSASDQFTGDAQEAGTPHSMVWDDKGNMWLFGGGQEGELGNGIWIENRDTPQKLEGFDGAGNPLYFVSGDCAETHTYALCKEPVLPPAVVMSATPGTTTGSNIVNWNNDPLVMGAFEDRAESFSLHYRRSRGAPAFASNGDAPGGVRAKILPDPGNGGLLTLLEITQLPVQGEKVLFVAAYNEAVPNWRIPLLWAVGTAYNTNDGVVGSDGTLYKAKSTNTGHDPALDTHHVFWEQVGNAGMPVNDKEGLGATPTSLGNTLLVQLQKAEGGKNAQYRLVQPATKEVSTAEKIHFGGGGLEKASKSVTVALSEHNPGNAHSFTHSFTGLPPTSSWPFADSEMQFTAISNFKSANPVPSSVTPAGGSSVNAIFTPIVAGDGKPEPGWFYRTQREEPFLKDGQGRGKTYNQRGEWLPSPTKYHPKEGTKKADWVYILIAGKPGCGFAAQKESSNVEPQKSPLYSAGTTYSTGALVKEAVEGITYRAMRATTGEQPSTHLGTAWEEWFWQEIPFFNPRGPWTASPGTPYKPFDWVWEKISATKYLGWYCLKETSTEPVTNATFWKSIVVEPELAKPEGWEQISGPGVVGTPMTVNIKLFPFKTSTAQNPGSPEYLEGEEHVRVEIQGSYSFPTAASRTAFGLMQVYSKPKGAKDVPAEIIAPRIINKTRPGAVRPQVGDVLEVVPGVWTDEGINPITDRKYRWGYQGLAESAVFEERPDTEELFGNKHKVTSASIGLGVRVVEWATNSVGISNEGALSEMTREVKK